MKKIPFRGGSGNVPTGAVQFEGDGPGLFIRGDEAGSLMVEIDAALAFIKERRGAVALMTMKRIRDIVANDVLTKKA